MYIYIYAYQAMTNKIMSVDFAACERKGVDQGIHNVCIPNLRKSQFWIRALCIAERVIACQGDIERRNNRVHQGMYKARILKKNIFWKRVLHIVEKSLGYSKSSLEKRVKKSQSKRECSGEHQGMHKACIGKENIFWKRAHYM